MAYCTDSDVRLITNITTEDIDTATMTELIVTADRRCDARIVAAGIELPLPAPYPPTLKDASAYFTAASCVNRKRIDLSRPNSLSVEGLTFGVGTKDEIEYLEELAEEALEEAIAELTGSTTFFEVVEGE